MAEETIATLNHSRILSLREENDPDKKSLSIGVYKGNGSFTVWENGKRPAQFPINTVTSAIILEILGVIASGESKLDRFPVTQRKYDENDRKYIPKCQCAILVDLENDRPRLIIELAENKERFRFPIVIPKSFDIEGCEFSKRQLLNISVRMLREAMENDIPIARRLSTFPYEKNGGGGKGNYGRSGGGGGGNYNRGGGGNSRDDDLDELPF